MSRQAISENIKRRLYAESMGKCMNPDCQTDLFLSNGDISEKAHIIPHCDTANNSFENLIILCPNCHTNFDKNSAFNEEEVKYWKRKRHEEVAKIFNIKYGTFKELEDAVKPILEDNKRIFENSYLKSNHQLWKKYQDKILVNNQKLKLLLQENRYLIQQHSEESYSNLATIDKLISHIDEFDITRRDEEKIRSVLFPEEVNSIFGIEPINEGIIPSTESLECLIKKLKEEGKFVEIIIGVDNPFIVYRDEDEFITLFLNDIPRIRQKYFEYKCFRKTGVRLESLNFAFKYMYNNGIYFTINDEKRLTNITVKETHLKFVYEYCLSKEDIISLSPKADLVIVNLHNWNGSSSISQEAYNQAEIMNVTLLTLDSFYRYVHEV